VETALQSRLTGENTKKLRSKGMEAVQEKAKEDTQNKGFEPEIVAFCCEF